MQIAKREKIFVIEDCSDAYGSFCDGKKCGSFGDVSITSFYPAHNITLAGEGGAILTNDDKLNKIIRSLRDWGRDCHCEAGQDNACGKRFKHKLNNILYDHKYIFSNIGYNLKLIESQAAFGIEQLKRIESFNIKRRENFINFKKEFKKFNKYLEFPKINDKANPAFFGLPLMIKNNDVNRNDLVRFLNKNKIRTRYLFGGNLIHQPAYKNIEYKICEKLTNTNKILKNLFWIGIHPNIGVEEIKYISSKFAEYFSKK